MKGCRSKRIVTILLMTFLVFNIFFVTNVNAAVTVDDIELPDLDLEFSSENFGFLDIDLEGLDDLSSLDDLDSLSQLDNSLGDFRSLDTLSTTSEEPVRANESDSNSPSHSIDSGLISDTSLDALINLDDITTTIDLDIDTASLLNLDVNKDSLDLNIDLVGASSLDINISTNNNQDEPVPEPANEPEMFDTQDFIDLINNFGAFLNNLAQLGGNSSTESLNADFSDNQLSAFTGSDLATSSLESDAYTASIDNPDTGDEIAIYFAILIVSGIGLIAIKKYKK